MLLSPEQFESAKKEYSKYFFIKLGIFLLIMGYIFFQGHSLSQRNREKMDAIDAQFDKMESKIRGKFEDLGAEDLLSGSKKKSKSNEEWRDERIKK